MTAGADTGADPQLEQAGAAAQPESQDTVSQHAFFLKSLLSRRPCILAIGPGHPSQPPQAVSQPQLGAAPQPLPQADSQPQLGAAPHGDSHPQLGSTAQPVSQQAFDGLRALSNSINGLRRGLQVAVSQPQLGPAPHADSHPQLGAAPQADSQPQLGPLSRPFSPHPLAQGDSHPQLGSAAQPPPHADSQPQLGPLNRPFSPQPLADSHPQLGSTLQPVSQHVLSQPAPLRPSIRSKSPPPKLGVQRLAPSIREPTNMFIFIETLLPKR
ncbi:MAG: hypothetical protein SFV81_11495 [Pirellulaceae bacterium]|nr:hypothetical protein [Pirellulaceae bacterium]